MLISKEFSIQNVNKRLGYTNIEITLRVFNHLYEELKSNEDNKLDKTLNF
ncbi:hypothetical protein UF66_0885 [Staphylococcus cohnii subsp. cohnii]|uniref:Integrase n=1 Tax=Staphylococcus cohnii subsp. cohnii TaxID=74704 RepID=A0A0M2NUB8_STACC|nr:hypothetical protein UF66_0885 [Staphylococcus cohnii subsp. cohnii]GEP87946.1 hypothetical protein SCO01_21360 [Staphylococcus cohnii subsp. cohnii]